MPVLRSIRERFAAARPLEGVTVGACLHVTAETANLVLALRAGGARVALCAANPLVTQADVASALGEDVHVGDYAAGIQAVTALRPSIVIDDGADLVGALHEAGTPPQGAIEETTTGLVRLRALHREGRLRCPVVAVNEALTERVFNDRWGTGQSTIEGILRATHLLLAGRTFVVLGYGWTGRGVAQRARGAGASVVVCEVDPLRGLEARMEGFSVMPALEAAEVGDVFVTVTGVRGALRREHLERMKDGAVLANAGHFDVEIDLPALRDLAVAPPHEVRPLVEQYVIGGDRKLNLLAGGRVVNLAAAEGHPPEVMDMSFANQALAVEELATGGDLPAGVHPLPPRVDEEVARLKLASLGVTIDELTPDQQAYRTSWG